MPVLVRAARKPAATCARDVLAWFAARPESGVTSGAHIAVVGDRLATDVALAHELGGWAVWIKDGVVPMEEKSVVSR